MLLSRRMECLRPKEVVAISCLLELEAQRVGTRPSLRSLATLLSITPTSRSFRLLSRHMERIVETQWVRLQCRGSAKRLSMIEWTTKRITKGFQIRLNLSQPLATWIALWEGPRLVKVAKGRASSITHLTRSLGLSSTTSLRIRLKRRTRAWAPPTETAYHCTIRQGATRACRLASHRVDTAPTSSTRARLQASKWLT